MLKFLCIKIGDKWTPCIIYSHETPTPTFVVVDTKNMSGLSEDEWIAQYKDLNILHDSEFKFESVKQR